MRGPILPILVTITGVVVYHAASKSVPRALHPMAAIVGAYLAAIVLCLLVAWRWPAAEPFPGRLQDYNWAVVGIGVGAALIEVGFLLAYRAGWPLNTANLLVNVSASLVLIPIGLVVFGERITLARVGGIGLCLAGLWLMTRR